MYQRSKLAYLDIYFSLIVFVILTILFHETTLDEKIAHLFYSPTLSWTYRDNFLLEKILHKGGVIFIILALVTLVSYVFYQLTLAIALSTGKGILRP
jgi:membrane-associated PAP2 superfamily phosphatase